MKAPRLPAKRPLERDVQRQIVQIARMAGCTVLTTSQVRPSMVSVGLPDLLIFGPQSFAWFEVKRPGGKLSADQARFRDLCYRCGLTFVSGGVELLWTLLQSWGLAERTLGQWGLTPMRAERAMCPGESSGPVQAVGRIYHPNDAAPGR